MPAKRDRQREYALEEEEARQRDLVAGGARSASREGRALGLSDLYPDLKLAKSVGYTRQSVPLLPMALLYEQLVVYVPPSNSQTLENRWGVGVDSFVELVDAGIVQPLVGHLPEYAAPHFRDLIKEGRTVPSVWTRGLTLLQEKGLEETLDESSYSLDFDVLATTPELLEKFRRHFPRVSAAELHRRIKRELLTNLADLYLFDEEEVVQSLQAGARKNSPADVARAIMLLSELRAYPILFGLGGTANYSSDLVTTFPSLGADLDWAIATPVGRTIKPNDFERVLKGIGIAADSMSVSDVIDFHASGQAKLLRKSVSEFEREASVLARSLSLDSGPAEQLLRRTEQLQEVLKTSLAQLGTPSEKRRYDRLRKQTTWAFEMGGLAVGGWLGHKVVGESWGAVGGAALVRSSLEYFKAGVAEAIVRPRFRPGVANLWRAKRGGGK